MWMGGGLSRGQTDRLLVLPTALPQATVGEAFGQTDRQLVSLIIDGYNLIHAAGIMGRGVGPGSLERARQALVRTLAASVEPGELGRTVVVFDAASGDVPLGLPRTETIDGVTVRFASGYDSADALIEELIRRDAAPRRLTVVSSDHRIQRAARRRRARAVDSDVWFTQLLCERRQRGEAVPGSAKPLGEVGRHEVLYWLKEFGLDGDAELSQTDQQDETAETTEQGRAETKAERPDKHDHWDNIFPPGYGDDLLDEAD